MKPRGPLMIEHRLIEKMLKVAEQKAIKMEKQKEMDPVLIDTIVDFIKTYADRTHHGKEEDLLFKDLEKKNLSVRDQRMMQELIGEHQYARKTVREIVEAKKEYMSGETSVLELLLEKLKALIKFYPEHITKEDKEFFPNTEKYFNLSELDNLLDRFGKFDQTMIHEKYRKLVAGLEP
jgi:hemerythrin-like domain-containing protein